jgi:hypothetical protein
MKTISCTVIGFLLFSYASAANHAVVTHHEKHVFSNSVQNHKANECPFGGIYLGLGIGGNFYKNEEKSTQSQNVNRFIGTLASGYGKVFDDVFYVGLEGMMDFTKSSNKDIYDNNGKFIYAKYKNGGFIPSVGVRLGYTNNSWLLYGKLSASYTSCTIEDTTDGSKDEINKITPALAIGFEKAFCRNFTTRLEGEYKFPSKKNSVSVNKGFAVRALVAYNVKL